MIKNENNELVKKIDEIPPCDEIFFAGAGHVLLRSIEGLTLYDIKQKKGVGQVFRYPLVFLMTTAGLFRLVEDEPMLPSYLVNGYEVRCFTWQTHLNHR